MTTVLAVLALAAAAALGVWVLARAASLTRALMKVTTGLTGLEVEVGRIAETARQAERTAANRGLGPG